MKLIFQFKQVDGPIRASGSGYAISKFPINVRFLNGFNVFWRSQEEYQKITRRLI